jgi:hypothetical protein
MKMRGILYASLSLNTLLLVLEAQLLWPKQQPSRSGPNEQTYSAAGNRVPNESANY